MAQFLHDSTLLPGASAGPDETETRNRLTEKLRQLRKASGYSLRQVAEATGTSASFLSQLERGLTGASTSTLMRLANCFGCSISELFAAAEISRDPVLRRSERPTLPVLDGHRKMLISRRPLTTFESYVSEFAPGGSTGPDQYTHGDSHEMILVLSGRALIELGPDSHLLEAGDCIEFMSSVPHRVANASDGASSVLFITSPPTSSPGYLAGFRPEAGEEEDPEPETRPRP